MNQSLNSHTLVNMIPCFLLKEQVIKEGLWLAYLSIFVIRDGKFKNLRPVTVEDGFENVRIKQQISFVLWQSTLHHLQLLNIANVTSI